MSTTSRLGSLLAVASIALLVVGCAPVPSTPPTPSIESPATATPADLPAPTPWAKISCPDLAAPADFAPLLSTAVAPVATPTNREVDTDLGPVAFSLRQAGGIECEWSNGLPPRLGADSNQKYVGASIRILPHATERWASYVAYYQGTLAENFACAAPGGANMAGHCSSVSLIGSNWVDIEFTGLVGASKSQLETDTTTIAHRIADTVRAAPSSDVRWSAPAGTQRLPFDCGQFFSVAEARAAMGAQSPDSLDFLDGGVSVTSSAWQSVGTSACPWGDADEFLGGGYHSWLPGGEWAWNETLASAAPGTYRTMAVPGLRSSDRAYSRCTPTDTTCFADLVIAHNWIQIAVEQLGPEAKTASAPAALAALSAATVKNLAAG